MNNKDADQTAQMCRLISVFVVRICHKQVFSWRGSYLKLRHAYMPDPLGGRENLMVFPPILWSYGGGCRSHGFWKNLIFCNFQYIWFILGHCGQKQADFMGGYDLSSLTRLKINTFSTVKLLIETSKWNSRLSQTPIKVGTLSLTANQCIIDRALQR